jgi:hypothetical protein
MHCQKYIQRARVYKAVTTLARRAGLTGDPFAPVVPQCGTLGEEWQIIHLLGELPRDLRQHPLAWRMLRAAVLTHGGGRAMTHSSDLSRRREILARLIGETLPIKQQFRRAARFSAATLRKVNRTRVLVTFPDEPLERVKLRSFGVTLGEKLVASEWSIPLAWLLLPGAIEPDPRQLPLFREAAA